MSTQVSTISPQQLHEVKRHGRYAPVLDVRSVAEYRGGHIAGAQLIPIDALSADALAQTFHEGEKLCVDNLHLDIHYTPGHTDDSYSFVLPDRVFTGDTLLIRGTGRTDFQNGDPAAQYDSLFGKLLVLPEDTLVYPAHDYNGMTVSTIGEEKRYNPRLQVAGKQAYIELMNGLELDDPQLMDIAVPANRACGERNAA